MPNGSYLDQLEPLSIVPVQFQDASRMEEPPEIGLLRAMLFDAIQLVMKPQRDSQSTKAEWREARAWIMSDSLAPFGFIQVATACGIHPGWLRQKILSSPTPKKRFHIKRHGRPNRVEALSD